MSRQAVAEMSAGAEGSAYGKRGEQTQNGGVYLCVFEQSILTDNRPNKSWSLLASVSGELLVVALLIVIPLIYGDHLPDFHWHTVTVGPPVRSLPQRQMQRAASSSPERAIFHRPDLFYPTQSAHVTEIATGPVTIDPPPGIQLSSEGGSGGPDMGLFTRAIHVKAPESTDVQAPTKPTGPQRVSGGVQMAKLMKQVLPVYPELLRRARITGVVHLVGIIGKDGTVRNLQLISGHPMLARAAMDAVAQWVYKPTLLSGEPVEVICPIDVNFTLNR